MRCSLFGRGKRRSISLRTLARAVTNARLQASEMRMGEPVRLLADAADVDKAYTLELGTLLQATERGLHLALQLCGWKSNARRQLYSSSSRHSSSCPHSPNRDKCLTPMLVPQREGPPRASGPFLC